MGLAADNDGDGARRVYARDGYLLCRGFFADEIALLSTLIDRDKRLILEREDVTIDKLRESLVIGSPRGQSTS